ncbi:MAG: alpha/beta fold hydrolase [Pirellulales bacterium]
MPIVRVSVGDIELSVLDEGHGLPVLLVHGFPLDHTMWREQIAALAGKHRVIAPDLRGFGQSEVTPGKVTMEQFADDLAALLAALEVREPVVLCGLSMGGYIAFQFWRKYAARLRGLVLCDTKAAPDSEEAAAQRLKLAELVLRTGVAVLSDNMLPKLFDQHTIAHRRDIVESIQAVVLRSNPQGVAAAQRGMAERPDMRPALKDIAAPTLMVVGETDAISPEAEMREIAAGIPGARLIVVPGAGHMAPLERPEGVNPGLLEFLARL